MDQRNFWRCVQLQYYDGPNDCDQVHVRTKGESIDRSTLAAFLRLPYSDNNNANK